MKSVKIILLMICLLPLIVLHIIITHLAFFYKIPDFQSLHFTEFREDRFRRGLSCYSVPKGKTGTAYKFRVQRDGKAYKPLYTISTERECYKQLDELEEKHIKIWYGIKYEDYIFNRKASELTDFEIYQLAAGDKIIISYQESLNSEERNRVGHLIMMVVLCAMDIYIYQKIKEKIMGKYYLEVNYDYRRYDRL